MKALIFILAILVSTAVSAEVLEGTAKNKKNEIVYLERHTIEKDSDGFNKLIRVEYFKPDGSQFATMTSNFSKSKTVPDTIFEDTRFKTKAIISLSDNFVEFQEIKDGNVVDKKKLPFDKKMVASQGFDNFIRLNFTQLDEKPVEFKFGVIDHKSFYSLTGYKKPSQSTEEVEYGIRASSWLLRIFAGELSVIYDSKTKRLKTFAGRSNILSDSGDSQDVVITYQLKKGA